MCEKLGAIVEPNHIARPEAGRPPAGHHRRLAERRPGGTDEADELILANALLLASDLQSLLLEFVLEGGENEAISRLKEVRSVGQQAEDANAARLRLLQCRDAHSAVVIVDEEESGLVGFC